MHVSGIGVASGATATGRDAGHHEDRELHAGGDVE